MSDAKPALTFAQREGLEPLPQQMQRTELSRPLRARLFALVRSQMYVGATRPVMMGDQTTLQGAWRQILYDVHVRHHHRMADEFRAAASVQDRQLKTLLADGTYADVYGFLEFVLRHQHCPSNFATSVQGILEETHAAYRIVGGNTFTPFTSDEEVAVVDAALKDTAPTKFAGIQHHLQKASQGLSAGDYAGSMRESFNAMESLTKLLTKEATFQDGVKRLAVQKLLHDTVRQGLEKYAAWTNAVADIRHANNPAQPQVQVTEGEAIYFLVFCSSTVSHLKRLGEEKGLL